MKIVACHELIAVGLDFAIEEIQETKSTTTPCCPPRDESLMRQR